MFKRNWFVVVLVCLVGSDCGGSFISTDQVEADDNSKKLEDAELICEKYAPSECDPAIWPDCPHEVRCQKFQTLRESCMATWTNTTEEGVKVVLKGCWNHQEIQGSTCSDNICVSTEVNKHPTYNMETHFCCCYGDRCNTDLAFIPEPVMLSTEGPPYQQSHDPLVAVFYIFVPICILAVVIFMVFWLYRRHKLGRSFAKSQMRECYLSKGPMKIISPTSGTFHSLEMLEVVNKGRFAHVWKGKLGNDTYAVKVFPPQDVDSWLQEQEIYVVHGMRKHPNILYFIAAEVKGSGFDAEYWLVTEFHPQGSLYDALKTRTVSFEEALHIGVTMLNGLAFLHEEIVERSEIQKPTIVHRDFKSKNVLLKNDLAACIADFGLALKCEHGQTLEDTHGQVGTRRYMAPEVLEGATEFTAIAFRQIDVYAAGLVLWEILSRCRLVPGEVTEEYKLPFEDEVGQYPTLPQMQDTVVNRKQRPVIKDSWTFDKRGSVLCHAITEMWDAEAEARISAGCALERLSVLIPADIVSPPVSCCQTVSFPSLQDSQTAEMSPLISDLATERNV